MKTYELIEGVYRPSGWKNHQFHFQWNQWGGMQENRGWERIYNFVLPKVAEAMGVPRRNVDFEGYMPTKGQIRVKITNHKIEVDMVKLMLPKIIKAKLEEVKFRNVTCTDAFTVLGKVSKRGIQFDFVCVDITQEYPQEWIDDDNKRRGKA